MVPLRVKPQWLPTGGTLGRRAGIANLISSFDLTILQHKKNPQKKTVLLALLLPQSLVIVVITMPEIPLHSEL